MQKANSNLCFSLIDEFPGDIKLPSKLAFAPDLEVIIEALADSVLNQIEIATHPDTHPAHRQNILEGVAEREAALHRVLALFEREEVKTTRMRVVRNTENELRIDVQDGARSVETGARRAH